MRLTLLATGTDSVAVGVTVVATLLVLVLVLAVGYLLKAVRESGYQGAYTLEIFSELHLRGSLWLDPLDTVTRSKTAFDRIWTQVCA